MLSKRVKRCSSKFGPSRRMPCPSPEIPPFQRAAHQPDFETIAKTDGDVSICCLSISGAGFLAPSFSNGPAHQSQAGQNIAVVLQITCTVTHPFTKTASGSRACVTHRDGPSRTVVINKAAILWMMLRLKRGGESDGRERASERGSEGASERGSERATRRARTRERGRAGGWERGRERTRARVRNLNGEKERAGGPRKSESGVGRGAEIVIESGHQGRPEGRREGCKVVRRG